jgi:DNA-binding GntR family transcriptional regulator
LAFNPSARGLAEIDMPAEVTFVFNRASLSKQVEAALRQEITLGRLRPGQKINASDYLANWNVSITPFRDAVRTLQNQGFVTVEPRKGVYVAPLNLKALQEIFELRIALECMAIELATSRAAAGDAERVRAAYLKAGVRVRKGDRALLAETDEAVHDFGRNSCGNARLQQLLSSHMDLIQWTQNTAIRKFPESRELALPEHIAIMDAVCARDAARASHAMRTHLDNAYLRMADRFEAAQVASSGEGAP